MTDKLSDSTSGIYHELCLSVFSIVCHEQIVWLDFFTKVSMWYWSIIKYAHSDIIKILEINETNLS